MPATKKATIQIISKASDCNILKYIACKFENNFSVLIISGKPSKEELLQAWDNIHTEYSDLTGTYIPELTIMKQIKALECRIQAMNIYVQLQYQCIERIGIPFFDGFPHLARYGHKLKWDEQKKDIPDFKKQLHRITASETRYIAELDARNKELADFRKEQSAKPSHDNSRTEFIRLLNELQKFGYKIDKATTTVEELGVMVFDYVKLINDSLNKSKHN